MRIGRPTPAARSSSASSRVATQSPDAPARSSHAATIVAPWPYASAFTTGSTATQSGSSPRIAARLPVSRSRSISSQAVRGSGGRPAATRRASIGSLSWTPPARSRGGRRSRGGARAGSARPSWPGAAGRGRSRSGRSEASRPASPRRSRTASPANPWSITPRHAASKGRRPWASSEPIVPARTSPVPPVARAGFSNGATAVSPVRRRDDGPGALEHDDVAPLDRGRARGPGPGGIVVDEVAVLVRRVAAARPQPPELADVRREDRRPAHALPPVVGRGEAAQRLGVEHDRRRRGLLRRARAGPR